MKTLLTALLISSSVAASEVIHCEEYIASKLERVNGTSGNLFPDHFRFVNGEDNWANLLNLSYDANSNTAVLSTMSSEFLCPTPQPGERMSLSTCFDISEFSSVFGSERVTAINIHTSDSNNAIDMSDADGFVQVSTAKQVLSRFQNKLTSFSRVSLKPLSYQYTCRSQKNVNSDEGVVVKPTNPNAVGVGSDTISHGAVILDQ